LLQKSNRFHDKKTLGSQKNTRSQKQTYHTVKMPRKCFAMPTIDIVQLIGNQRKKKTGDSSNTCVCLYRSLKPLADDQVTSQRFNSKHIILSCVI